MTILAHVYTGTQGHRRYTTCTALFRRVLVTGSRDWYDTETIRRALATVWHPRTVLVVGDARGADHLAAQCWRHWGGHVEVHAADWGSHGRRAGIIRNLAMINSGADLCLAFIKNNSHGATHCANAAEDALIPTRRFKEN